MKKIIYLSLFVALVAPSALFAQVGSVTAQAVEKVSPVSISVSAAPTIREYHKGDKSDIVRELQQMLSEDAEIYPEGLVTGYYGRLTEAAIERLQGRYDLPRTGVFDKATQNVIFPVPTNMELTLVSPNGGEGWEQGSVHNILWKTMTGPVLYRGQEIIPLASSDAVGATSVAPDIRAFPFFPRATLELVRDSSPRLRYHIATVNLYDSQYRWKIPVRIPAAKDYRVQIRYGARPSCLDRLRRQDTASDILIAPCPLLFDAYHASDNSDGTFAISAGAPPPVPNEVVENIKRQLSAMEGTIEMLLKQIATIRRLLETL